MLSKAFIDDGHVGRSICIVSVKAASVDDRNVQRLGKEGADLISCNIVVAVTWAWLAGDTYPRRMETFSDQCMLA